MYRCSHCSKVFHDKNCVIKKGGQAALELVNVDGNASEEAFHGTDAPDSAGQRDGGSKYNIFKRSYWPGRKAPKPDIEAQNTQSTSANADQVNTDQHHLATPNNIEAHSIQTSSVYAGLEISSAPNNVEAQSIEAVPSSNEQEEIQINVPAQVVAVTPVNDHQDLSNDPNLLGSPNRFPLQRHFSAKTLVNEDQAAQIAQDGQPPQNDQPGAGNLQSNRSESAHTLIERNFFKKFIHRHRTISEMTIALSIVLCVVFFSGLSIGVPIVAVIATQAHGNHTRPSHPRSEDHFRVLLDVE